MKLLRSTKKDFDADKVVLVYCNLVKNDYQHTQKFYLVLFQINNLES